jgi:hypothetical protein
MADLSDSVQAIQCAVTDRSQEFHWQAREIAAAAIRETAKQIAKIDSVGDATERCISSAEREYIEGFMNFIADELERVDG